MEQSLQLLRSVLKSVFLRSPFKGETRPLRASASFDETPAKPLFYLLFSLLASTVFYPRRWDTVGTEAMPQKIRSAKLETRSARLRLAVRGKPYFIKLARGIALGYRRNKTAGTWLFVLTDTRAWLPIAEAECGSRWRALPYSTCALSYSFLRSQELPQLM